MSIEPAQPIAFTIRDAMAFSGLSRTRLYRLIKEGELPSMAIGGRRMIRRADLESYFAGK